MTLPRPSSTGGGLCETTQRRIFRHPLLSIHWESHVHGGGGEMLPYIEPLVVELGELAEHGAGLLLVLAHGAGEGVGPRRADHLLVVGDVYDEQGAQLGDQLQPQGVPQPGDAHIHGLGPSSFTSNGHRCCDVVTYFSARSRISCSVSNLATQTLWSRASPLASVLSVGRANSISRRPCTWSQSMSQTPCGKPLTTRLPTHCRAHHFLLVPQKCWFAGILTNLGVLLYEPLCRSFAKLFVMDHPFVLIHLKSFPHFHISGKRKYYCTGDILSYHPTSQHLFS